MRVTWLKLTIAALVLSGLITLVLLDPKLADEVPAQTISLTTLAPADVDHIIVSRSSGNRIELKRDQNAPTNWRLVAPIQARANPVRAAAIASLAGARSNLSYAVAGAKLAELNLSPPQIQLRLNNAVIGIGGRQELDDLRYVRTGAQVLLLQDRFVYHLSNNAATYVDPALFTSATKLVQIQTPEVELRLHQGEWQWSPQAAFQSVDEIAALVSLWLSLSALEVATMDYERTWLEAAVLTTADGTALRLLYTRDNTRVWLGVPTQDLQYGITVPRAEALLRKSLPTSG